jgi:hypothetical protein
MHQQIKLRPEPGYYTRAEKLDLIEREVIYLKQEEKGLKKQGRKFGPKRQRRLALLRAIAKDLRSLLVEVI